MVLLDFILRKKHCPLNFFFGKIVTELHFKRPQDLIQTRMNTSLIAFALAATGGLLIKEVGYTCA